MNQVYFFFNPITDFMKNCNFVLMMAWTLPTDDASYKLAHLVTLHCVFTFYSAYLLTSSHYTLYELMRRKDDNQGLIDGNKLYGWGAFVTKNRLEVMETGRIVWC